MKCLMRRIRIYRSSGWLYVPVQQQPFFTRSLSNPGSPPSHIFSLMKLARYQLTKVFHWSQGKKEKEKRPFCILRKKTGLKTLNPKPKSCTEFVLVIFSSHNCGLILCKGWCCCFSTWLQVQWQIWWVHYCAGIDSWGIDSLITCHTWHLLCSLWWS